ncbi:hypothetical protein MRX96_018845 [Rhipicephalus microplus]
MLLALLTNATQSPNSTSDRRAELLWDHLLENVRGALYSTSSDGWSGSPTAPHPEARIPLANETSTTNYCTSSSSAEVISFEAEDMMIVDYGKINDHVVLDAGARSPDSGSQTALKKRCEDLNSMRGDVNEYASFLNYDDVKRNVDIGKVANDRNEAVKRLNDTSGLGSLEGTGHLYADYVAGAHNALSATNYISVAQKDHRNVSVYSLTTPNSNSIAKNQARRNVSLTLISPHYAAVQGADSKPSDMTERDARTREVRRQVEWANSSFRSEDPTREEASAVQGEHTETGSNSCLQTRANQIAGRVTWASRTSGKGDFVVYSAEGHLAPEGLGRRVVAQERTRNDHIPLLERIDVFFPSGLTLNSMLLRSGWKTADELIDSKINTKRINKDVDDKTLVPPKSDISGSAFGTIRSVSVNSWQASGGFPGATFDYNDAPHARTKLPGYGIVSGVSGAKTGYNYNATDNLAGSSVLNSVRWTGPKGKILAGDEMYRTEAKNPSPGSIQEHLVTIYSASHLRLPTATEIDRRNSSLHPKARVSNTLPVGYAKSEVNISTNSLSATPEDSGSRGWTEGRKSASDPPTRQSVAKDRVYQARQWPQGGKNRPGDERELDERPLLNSEPPSPQNSPRQREREFRTAPQGRKRRPQHQTFSRRYTATRYVQARYGKEGHLESS